MVKQSSAIIEDSINIRVVVLVIVVEGIKENTQTVPFI